MGNQNKFEYSESKRDCLMFSQLSNYDCRNCFDKIMLLSIKFWLKKDEVVEVMARGNRNSYKNWVVSRVCMAVLVANIRLRD